MKERGRRKQSVGVVVSDKMDKTIVVDAERFVRHPRYGKYVRRRTRYHVHDEENKAKVGDKVQIMEARPLSKNKAWRLVKVLHEGSSR